MRINSFSSGLKFCDVIVVQAAQLSQLVLIMAFGTTVYNLLFRRTSTFALTILVGAVFFERVFDHGADALWDRMNRGVSDVSK